MIVGKSLLEFLSSREWTIYPFIPPLSALSLSLFLIPFYEHVLDVKLRAFIEGIKSANPTKLLLIDYRKISQLLQTRALQIAYLSEIPAFLVSVFTTLQSSKPWLLTAIVAVMFILYLFVIPNLFMRNEPDYVSTEHPRWEKWFLKKGFTYLSFYAKILALLNVVLIVIIIATLPKK
jgi:hypothetical protein